MKRFPLVQCPACHKRGDWLSGPYGPFCSRRCKLVDLGKWLNEEHCISEPLRPEHLARLEDLPPAPPPAAGEGRERT
jgi:hypothetical protein